jgi:4-amino-4-deoxy-L-arabinose transferase-like glycosyltransferase
MAALEQRLRDVVALLARHWVIVISLLVLVVTLPTLGERPLRFEEGRRVVQILAMAEGGPMLRPETFGEHYVNKPPGLPWLMLWSSNLFGGISEFAIRIPSIIAVLGGALLAGLVAHRLAPADRRIAALGAAAAFIGSTGIFMTLRLAETDGPAIFFAMLALTIWMLARLAGRLGVLAWAGIAAALGAAIFIKGPPPTLFAILPMVIVPLRQRRWGELAALVVALGVAALPILTWVWANADAATPQHLSREMRLVSGSFDAWLLSLKAVPATFANGIAQALPAIALGLGYLWRERAWRWRETEWPTYALFIASVPMFVIVLLWPGSVGRYGLPAIWPFAVLSGLLIERMWQARNWQGRLAPTITAAMLLVFLAVQGTYGALEGRTDFQRRQRAIAEELHAAVSPLPPQQIAILSAGRDYNRYSYVGRNGAFVEGAQVACLSGPHLLVEDDMASTADLTAWRSVSRLDVAAVTLFERQSPPSACQ